MRRATVWTLMLVLASISTAACDGSKSDDIKTICDAPLECRECAQVAPEMRMSVMARNIEEALESSDGRAFFRSLAEMEPAERVAQLRQRAEEAGLTGCALADMFAEALP